MSWTQIKKALNSTLGTKDFKSLDNIIKDNFRIVGTEDLFYIYNGTYSDYVYISSRDETGGISSNEFVSIGCNGTAYIDIPITFFSRYDNLDFVASAISSSGEILGKTYYTAGSAANKDINTTIRVNIPIVSKNKFKIKVSMINNTQNEVEITNLRLSSFQIKGTLIGGTYQFETDVEETE